MPASALASSASSVSSKNFCTLTSSLIPFRLLVFTMNSLASACTGLGSSGRSTMLRSSGSPGTTAQ